MHALLLAHGFLSEKIVGPSDPSDELSDSCFLRHGSMDGVRVDLLVAKTLFEAQAVEGAVRTVVAGVSCRVARAEDLIVYELVAFRPRDRDDIANVIDIQRRVRAFDDRRNPHPRLGS